MFTPNVCFKKLTGKGTTPCQPNYTQGGSVLPDPMYEMINPVTLLKKHVRINHNDISKKRPM